jgi:hypothetical protein
LMNVAMLCAMAGTSRVSVPAHMCSIVSRYMPSWTVVYISMPGSAMLAVALSAKSAHAKQSLTAPPRGHARP